MNISPRKILCIDDDPEIHDVFRAVFAAPDFEYSAALSAAQGMKALKEEYFDLVIVEGFLPDQPGLRLCMDIRADERLAGIKIIFVASGMKQVFVFRKLYVDIRVNLILHKPVNPAELLNAARKLLNAPAEPSAENDPLAELRQDFENSYIEKLSLIEDCISRLEKNPDDRAALEEIHLAVHRIHGTAGVFGRANASAAAAEWEDELSPLLNENAPLTGDWLKAFWARLDSLILHFQTPDEKPEPETGTGEDEEHKPPAAPLMLLVDDDTDFLAAVESAAANEALRMKCCSTPGEALKAVAEEKPDIIFLDIAFNVSMDGYAVARRMRENENLRKTPIVFVTAKRTLYDRVEAARSGGVMFLEKPVSPGKLFEVAEKIVNSGRNGKGTVLFAGFDIELGEALSEALAAEGFVTVSAPCSGDLMEEIRDIGPELLMINHLFPGYSGFDVCRALRAEPETAYIPVIIISPFDGMEPEEEVRDAGADDFMSLPLELKRLAARASLLAARARKMKQLDSLDSLTGVLNSSRFLEELTQRISGRDSETGIALAVLAVDDLAKINDTHGKHTGNEVIAALADMLSVSLGHGALAGRWSGGGFAVSAPGMNAGELTHLLGSVLDDFREKRFRNPAGEHFSAKFSAGVAETVGGTADVNSLIAAAERGLEVARNNGGGAVFQGTTVQAGRAALDVLVVEDDEAVRGLLGYALKTRGYSHELISDGHEALKRLTEPGAAALPRLLLLDVNLPGFDGFSILAEMKKSPAAQKVKVIMLTAHGREDDLLRAFESGASDYVTKPFSVPVLMHRIRVALA